MTITLHHDDLPSNISFGDCVAVDTESMGLNWDRDRLCLIQLSSGDGNAHLVQLPAGNYAAPNLKKLMTDPKVIKLFHFARADLAAIKRYLDVMPTPVYCTKVASVLVRTYAWLVLLQRNGVVNDLLTGLGLVDAPMQLLRTEGAVVLAMSHVLLPFVVLPLYATLRAIPDDYARAARMLGANGFAVFRHVTLPLSMPGITSGCVMVFLLALGFFVTPALIGGPQQMMLATLVQQQVTELLNWPFAGAIIGVLLLAVLGLMIVFHRVIRLDRFVGQAGGGGRN